MTRPKTPFVCIPFLTVILFLTLSLSSRADGYGYAVKNDLKTCITTIREQDLGGCMDALFQSCLKQGYRHDQCATSLSHYLSESYKEIMAEDPASLSSFDTVMSLLHARCQQHARQEQGEPGWIAHVFFISCYYDGVILAIDADNPGSD